MLKQLQIVEEGEDIDSDLNSLTFFVNEVYYRCKSYGITPKLLTSWIINLLNFDPKKYVDTSNSSTKLSQNNANKVTMNRLLPFISEISEYIEDRKKEAEKINKYVAELERKIAEYETQKNELIQNIKDLELKNQSILNFQNAFNKLNETLQYGYNINLAKNPLPFAKLMNDFQNNNYDITSILEEYNKVGNLKSHIIEKQTQLQARTNELSKLNQESKSCEAMLSIHRKNLDIYQRLEVMKFGIKELEQLWLTVSEIVRDHCNPLRDHNNIENPVTFFMKDVEDNYYNKLKFEDKVNAKRTELSMINAQINYNRQILQLQPFIGSNLLSLFQKGIDEQDIIEVSRIFNNNQSLWDLFVDESKGKGNTLDPNNNNNNHIVKEKRWRILVDELKKYGGLKAMVKKQEDRLYKLEKESSMLFYQAQALGTICHNYLNL
ncbi:hypothetical protein [Candidatus Nitrosocosmicus franklandus]|uniref:Uncharacterized protein n=1 Tax=Candidatus Nitrosocosmicus franklandianus TaxID=1798806 RepID=A0A484ID32_9ARCH|nr:hypothetical protein [Candidatus Nitrosocosmicus franklandus]VFJ14129.1 protein of unknown function [Candidatus Nitrosocosmicus franklandus]